MACTFAEVTQMYAHTHTHTQTHTYTHIHHREGWQGPYGQRWSSLLKHMLTRSNAHARTQTHTHTHTSTHTHTHTHTHTNTYTHTQTHTHSCAHTTHTAHTQHTHTHTHHLQDAVAGAGAEVVQSTAACLTTDSTMQEAHRKPQRLQLLLLGEGLSLSLSW